MPSSVPGGPNRGAHPPTHRGSSSGQRAAGAAPWRQDQPHAPVTSSPGSPFPPEPRAGACCPIDRRRRDQWRQWPVSMGARNAADEKSLAPQQPPFFPPFSRLVGHPRRRQGVAMPTTKGSATLLPSPRPLVRHPPHLHRLPSAAAVPWRASNIRPGGK